MPLLKGLGKAAAAEEDDEPRDEAEDDAEGALDMGACDAALEEISGLAQQAEGSELDDDDKAKFAELKENADALHEEIVKAADEDPEDAAKKADELKEMVAEAKALAADTDLGNAQSEEGPEDSEAAKDPGQRELQQPSAGSKLLQWAKS